MTLDEVIVTVLLNKEISLETLTAMVYLCQKAGIKLDCKYKYSGSRLRSPEVEHMVDGLDSTGVLSENSILHCTAKADDYKYILKNYSDESALNRVFQVSSQVTSDDLIYLTILDKVTQEAVHSLTPDRLLKQKGYLISTVGLLTGNTSADDFNTGLGILRFLQEG